MLESVQNLVSRVDQVMQQQSISRAKISRKQIASFFPQETFPMILYRSMQEAFELRGYMVAHSPETGGFVVCSIQALSGAKPIVFGEDS